MAWHYYQKTGALKHNDGLIGMGYSGKGDFKNNPDAQNIHDLGPIPVGVYLVGDPQDTKSHGPFVLPLTPDAANDMFGRSGFLIHGDSIEHPGFASDGCIIVGRDLREQIWESGDLLIEVHPDET